MQSSCHHFCYVPLRDVPKETEDAIVVETPKAKRQKRDNEEAETVTVKKVDSVSQL